MSTIYSRRLAGPANVPAGTQTLYTCPSGIVAVVMSLGIVVAAGIQASTVVLGIGGVAASQRIFRRLLNPDTTTFELEMRWVLQQGETIQSTATVSTGATITAMLCGYELLA